MRLICPNCDAQYDVEDGAVPPEGRDVQCSNCSHVWYQRPDGPSRVERLIGRSAAAEAAAMPETDPAALEIIHEEVERETQARQEEGGALETQDDLGLDAAGPLERIAAARARRSSDDEAVTPALEVEPDHIPEVTSEPATELATEPATGATTEPEFEAEPEPVVSETDTASSKEDAPSAQPVAETAPTEELAAETTTEAERDPFDAPSETDKGILDEQTDDAAAEEVAKRQRLPDIEEINSTLSDAPIVVVEDQEAETDAQRLPRRRRGFRIGFGLALMATALLIGIYVQASELAERFPDYADIFTQIGENGDRFRIWLDGTAQDLVEVLTKLIANFTDTE